MSLLAAIAVFGTGLFAAATCARHNARRVLIGHRTRTRVATAAQHHAPPYVQRVPGQTLAAYRSEPTPAEVEAWETDDLLPADDLWSAWCPPGSLGDYPDGMPGPGVLAGEPSDVEDLLTGVIRHLRQAAEHN